MATTSAFRISYTVGNRGVIRDAAGTVLANCGHWHRTRGDATMCARSLYRSLGGDFTINPRTQCLEPTDTRTTR